MLRCCLGAIGTTNHTNRLQAGPSFQKGFEQETAEEAEARDDMPLLSPIPPVQEAIRQDTLLLPIR